MRPQAPTVKGTDNAQRHARVLRLMRRSARLLSEHASCSVGREDRDGTRRGKQVPERRSTPSMSIVWTALGTIRSRGPNSDDPDAASPTTQTDRDTVDSRQSLALQLQPVLLRTIRRIPMHLTSYMIVDRTYFGFIPLNTTTNESVRFTTRNAHALPMRGVSLCVYMRHAACAMCSSCTDATCMSRCAPPFGFAHTGVCDTDAPSCHTPEGCAGLSSVLGWVPSAMRHSCADRPCCRAVRLV